MDAHQESLKLWLRMLVLKGVEELVLVNRPWPLDVPLPVTLLNITTLTRLFIGVWKFPDTSGLPRGAGFPNLRELTLCCVAMKNRDMEFVLARSPALETLGLQGIQEELCLRLIGHSLQCVQICFCVVESITIVNTPRLDRLILWGSLDGSCIRLKIDHAPKLRLLGYLELGMHKLESGNSTINATMSPSVKILSLSVRFGVRSEVKMLPTFLRRFPNVETLHIKSEKSNDAIGKVNLKFWREAGPIESIQSSMKVMSFHDFRGERSEIAFLKFFLQNARVLQTVVIVTDSGCSLSIDELQSKVRSLDPDNWASQDCSLMVHLGSDPEGGALWDFRKGLDVSVGDPFVRY
ncbi:hypothetical protein EJB05_40406 [Eragrostis curvula]|uniref:Uncharacterized protein n=1 Tax=Eragrostis curvula TaxID=38414 RepID=A0A5J9TPR8_9POAL|nr:hypothetical protein EJB05_40406 [Eragrostis curvula]